MLKKIILFIFIYIIISLSNVLAFSIPVENVFSDINRNYKYYNELQTFYDKGIISPDINGKFNPRKLLNRDEFIGISMGVSCKKCIAPDIAPSFINLFTNTVSFFDVLPKNKYFYCIAEAKDKNYIKGYALGSSCENGISKINKKPFCPSNKISLEEAIAIVLRTSGIFTISDNINILNKIRSGVSLPDLSPDVSAKNIDGSVNSFYGYLQKALNYEYRNVDINGNVKVYKLLTLKSGKIRPKKSVTKEEFLRIAYIALKTNSCNIINNNKLAIQIKILDKSCDSIKKNCKLSKLTDKTNIYDFSSKVAGICTKGISLTNGYTWRFYNQYTGKQIIKHQKYIDNYNFLSNGNWRVYLRILDKCGNTGEVYNNIVVNTNTNTNKTLSLFINGSPISGVGPLNSSFTGIVSGGVGPYDFNWDFGDGNTGFGKNIKNIFNKAGLYIVKLVVSDSNGLHTSTIVNVQVISGQNYSIDSDNDLIKDYLDLCPLIPGDILNNGCPILSQLCQNESSCLYGYTCSNNGTSNQGICVPILINTANSTCLIQNNLSTIYGNASCNSCPCSNFLDFKSTIRRCDTIFPAITSPDGTKIYSKGKDFFIK